MAIIMALLALILTTTMGMSMVLLGSNERAISRNWDAATRALYAAEAGVEWAKVQAAENQNWPSLAGQYADPEPVRAAAYTVTISQPDPLDPLTLAVSSAARTADGAERTVFATLTSFCENVNAGAMPTEVPCRTPAGQASQSIHRAVKTTAWGAK